MCTKMSRVQKCQTYWCVNKHTLETVTQQQVVNTGTQPWWSDIDQWLNVTSKWSCTWSEVRQVRLPKACKPSEWTKLKKNTEFQNTHADINTVGANHCSFEKFTCLVTMCYARKVYHAKKKIRAFSRHTLVLCSWHMYWSVLAKSSLKTCTGQMECSSLKHNMNTINMLCVCQ